ncbi:MULTISPECIES: DUF2878 domain-containing protein [Rheinheimera]|uniref:DUF2878 domain-containing protein n=1 Tax=Rheinheimera marina TaxID=1774958 RepID=A0ABV9JN08_9GAMM
MRLLLNSCLFNLAWFGCVYWGNGAALLVPVWAGLHLWQSARPKAEALLLISVMVGGALLDSLWMLTAVFIFPGQPWLLPFWLLMLWLAFAMTLNGYLSVLKGRVWLQSLAGALAGPFSYWAGQQLGAVQFGAPLPWVLLMLSLAWAALLPALFLLNQRVYGVTHEKTLFGAG